MDWNEDKIRSGNNEIMFLCFLYILYVVSLFTTNKLLATELFLLSSFLTIVIFYKSIQGIQTFRTSLQLLFCGAVSSFIVNCLWLIGYEIAGDAAKYLDIFVILYFLPNIFIVIASIHYFKKNIYNLESVQLIIDVVTVVILMISFAIMFFMDTNCQIEINLKYLIAVSYVITDVASISIMLIIKLSISDFENENLVTMLGIGILMFTILDLIFIYQVLDKGHYETITFLEYYNFIPYIIFTFVAIYTQIFEDNNLNKRKYKLPYNIKTKRKNSFIMLLPIVFMIFIKRIELYALIVFLAIILIRELLSHYVKTSFYTKQLLIQEKVVKHELESRVRDRTRELLMANKRLEEIVNKDYLTKIYNRRYFNIEVDRLLKESNVGEVTLFFIDLIRFKFINDSFGHDIGDEILISVARRLIKIIPKEAVVCRLGGDEFAIILKGLKHKEELSTFAERILETVGKEVIINNYKFNIKPSIGIAVSKENSNRRNLLKSADFAMYRCKQTIGSYYEFYDEELNNQLERKNEIEKLLKSANFNEEFSVNYQPQFDINTKVVKGIEALVRWNSKELGKISPSEFIPIAEECGMIESIGNWVLLEALKQVKAWNKKFGTKLRASVNVSPGQINSVGFIENLLEVVSSNNISTKLVNLEITEGVKLEGNEFVKDTLEKLSGLGFSISIDDFGTGYASFSYIEKFNINELKIDKSLIDNISDKSSDLKVVKAIIMMAKGLNIETIAEGIETEDQLEKIKNLGCDEIQGYLWSKPLTNKEFEKKYLELNYCIRK